MLRFSDENDPAYADYLRVTQAKIVAESVSRNRAPTRNVLESWHLRLYGPVAHLKYGSRAAGNVRQPDIFNQINQEVGVGGIPGVHHKGVRGRMKTYDRDLLKKVKDLDRDWGNLKGSEKIKAVASLCAWAHGEIIRIHPFMDCNGRTSRLAVNSLLARYSIPLVLDSRPRPPVDYPNAAASSMRGNDSAMEQYLIASIARALAQRQGAASP